MQRSEINSIMRESDAFIRSFGFFLPPFAYWSPQHFRERRSDVTRIVEAGLGWDITDYGSGDFRKTGLFLFTLRNGDIRDLARGRGMLYAEKIMIVLKDQLCPLHRHNLKAEDIINRGGGRLVVEVYESRPDGSIDDGSIDDGLDGSKGNGRVRIVTDGLLSELPAGGRLSLSPGESVTLPPGIWHAFWAEEGDTLVGEVSTVNDDRTDNVFKDPVGRFPDIIEDEPPRHLLVPDYDRLL